MSPGDTLQTRLCSSFQLRFNLSQSFNVARYDAQSAFEAVVFYGAPFPHLQPLVTTLYAMVLVVLAIVRLLRLIYSNTLQNRFRSRH